MSTKSRSANVGLSAIFVVSVERKKSYSSEFFLIFVLPDQCDIFSPFSFIPNHCVRQLASKYGRKVALLHLCRFEKSAGKLEVIKMPKAMHQFVSWWRQLGLTDFRSSLEFSMTKSIRNNIRFVTTDEWNNNCQLILKLNFLHFFRPYSVRISISRPQFISDHFIFNKL